jgi:hypothetical protein
MLQMYKFSKVLFSYQNSVCLFYFTLRSAYPTRLIFTCNFLYFLLHFTLCLVFFSNVPCLNPCSVLKVSIPHHHAIYVCSTLF